MTPTQGVCWRTSSYSGSNGNCVQVGDGGTIVHVRDSKDPNGAVLSFRPSEWNAFVGGIKDGEFDRT